MRMGAVPAATVGLSLLFVGCPGKPATERPEKPGAEAEPPTPTMAKTLTPSSGGELVLITGGTFTMGDAKGRSDETPHTVTVGAFYMDRVPVTQAHYERLMGKNPSKWKAPDSPVEQLRWREAAAFCNKSSKLDGLAPCYDAKTWACDFKADGYRLPTEAEWEYACRAGTSTRYFFGDDGKGVDNYGWHKRNSGGRTRPVGKKLPNPWGLYDMCGNVWEWCNDFYAADYYKASPGDNPTGPPTGEQRVLRGGAFNLGADRCRAAYRFKDFADYGDVCFGYDSYGFRRVRKAVPTR